MQKIITLYSLKMMNERIENLISIIIKLNNTEKEMEKLGDNAIKKTELKIHRHFCEVNANCQIEAIEQYIKSWSRLIEERKN